jgi:flagellar hook-length control protein FliK
MACLCDDRPEDVKPKAAAPEQAARPAHPRDAEETAAGATRFAGKAIAAKPAPEATEKPEDATPVKAREESPVTGHVPTGEIDPVAERIEVQKPVPEATDGNADGQSGSEGAEAPQAPRQVLAGAEPSGKAGAASDRSAPEKSGQASRIDGKTTAQSAQLTAEQPSTRPGAVPTAGSATAAMVPALPDLASQGPLQAASPAAAALEPSGRVGTAPAPAPTAPVVQTQRGDWPQTVVSASLSALTPDGGTMTLDLAPQELGALRITLVLEGDRASVSIQTETPEAARVLNEAQRDLAQEFARNGVTLSAHDAQTGGRGTPRPGPALSPDETGDAPHSDPAVHLPPQGILNLIA